MKLLAAFVGVLVGMAVGPFAQDGLDETICLAVGAWCTGPGAAIHEPKRTADGHEAERTGRRATVGKHGLEPDAQPA